MGVVWVEGVQGGVVGVGGEREGLWGWEVVVGWKAVVGVWGVALGAVAAGGWEEGVGRCWVQSAAGS